MPEFAPKDVAETEKGFGTGLTFGLVGNTVRDGYEMTVALTLNGKSVTKTGYKHLLISTVGNATAPPGLKPTTPSAGVATIVEQMLLNALRDLQGDGLLVHRNQESAASLAEAGAPVGTANPGYW